MSAPDIETIMRRVGELHLTDMINIVRCNSGDWQVSISRGRGGNSFGIGIAPTMDEAFRKAVSPPYGTSYEQWLKLDSVVEEEDDDDDWRDLV